MGLCNQSCSSVRPLVYLLTDITPRPFPVLSLPPTVETVEKWTLSKCMIVTSSFITRSDGIFGGYFLSVINSLHIVEILVGAR